MHREILEVDGQRLEVLTFDTRVHANQPIEKIMRQIERLIDEDKKFKRDGKLTAHGWWNTSRKS